MSGLFGGGSKNKSTTSTTPGRTVDTDLTASQPATATPTTTTPVAPAYAIAPAASTPTPTAPPATDPAIVAMDTRRRLAAGKYRSTLITDEVGGGRGGSYG